MQTNREGAAEHAIVEHRAIEQIPESERHGTAGGLLPLWFSMNSSVLAMATGAIGIAMGASLASTVAAIVIGNLFGALFMAYHSAQGPKLGLPQMIQSRAQFGFFGSALPNIMVVAMYIGYFISAAVLGGQAVASLLGVSVTVGLAISSLVNWLVAWLGYRAIHSFNRVMAILSLITLAVLAVRVFQHLGAAHYVAKGNTAASFMVMLSVAASWQITFAPYVSDYSRYLPSTTSTARTFVYTYIGSISGSILFMSVGAVAGVEALSKINSNAVGYLSGLVPGAGWLFTLLLFLGLVAGNCENLYGPYVTGLATVTRAGGRVPSEWTRFVTTGVLAAICGWVGAAVSANFLANFTNFITFLLYMLVPWTAINLMDFYFVRHGRYDVEGILSVDGPYGLVNWTAIGIYLLAAAVEVPFMNTTIYEGPIAKALGGSDIAWIVGLAVAGGTYLAVHRLRRRSGEELSEPTAEAAVEGLTV